MEKEPNQPGFRTSSLRPGISPGTVLLRYSGNGSSCRNHVPMGLLAAAAGLGVRMPDATETAGLRNGACRTDAVWPNLPGGTAIVDDRLSERILFLRERDCFIDTLGRATFDDIREGGEARFS